MEEYSLIMNQADHFHYLLSFLIIEQNGGTSLIIHLREISPFCFFSKPVAKLCYLAWNDMISWRLIQTLVSAS